MAVIAAHWLVGIAFVTLSLTVNETLKWLSSLPILMQESFWWWQCSDRYIISLSPHLRTPLPPHRTPIPIPISSPSVISFMVSIDVKHRAYLLTPFPIQPTINCGPLFRRHLINDSSCLWLNKRYERSNVLLFYPWNWKHETRYRPFPEPSGCSAICNHRPSFQPRFRSRGPSWPSSLNMTPGQYCRSLTHDFVTCPDNFQGPLVVSYCLQPEGCGWRGVVVVLKSSTSWLLYSATNNSGHFYSTVYQRQDWAHRALQDQQ